MKKTICLLFTFAAIGCSTDETAKTANTSYITDSDFTITVVGWESWGDVTDDGITQNVLLEKGTGGTVTFTKATGEVKVSDSENEIADSSADGLLVFNNYWDNNPKTVDFTQANKYTINYDSRKDSQSGSYEVSTRTVYYK